MQVCIQDTKVRRLTEMPLIKLYVNLRKYDASANGNGPILLRYW